METAEGGALLRGMDGYLARHLHGQSRRHGNPQPEVCEEVRLERVLGTGDLQAPQTPSEPAESLMNLTSGKPRGCGERKAGDLYLCVGQSEGGKPIEHFMLDPPIPWHKGHFQGCELFTRSDGIVDIIMWVGAEHYPFIPDFIEEARHHGISKKIPRSGDYSMLTPFKSTLMLVHPRCIHNVQYNLKSKNGCSVDRMCTD